LFIPSVYYARPYNEDITLGISLTVPAGVGQDPGNGTPGRYLLEEWTLGYVSLAPAVGYRVNEQLSLGAALNFNYAAYDYETAVFKGPGLPDGHMELSDGDFSFGFQLGLLYEVSPTTRFGLMYRSLSDCEFSDTPELSGLTPEREALLDQGIRGKEIGLESEFPQIVAAGAYHEFGNGRSATVDVAWIDFSEFGLTEATLNDTAVATKETQYDDMCAASVGYNWPVNEDWTMRVGVAYVSSGVEDENRSFTFRLDRIIGAGVGAEYRWGSDKALGVNLTYYDLGEAPVQNDLPLLGTLSGEYSDNYAIGFDINLRWTPR
jgi:long-chain fatty acid transport protein